MNADQSRRLLAAYHAHEEASALLLRVNSTSMQARGTKHEKTAHAAKTLAKQEAKAMRQGLMDVAREVLGVEGVFPVVLAAVEAALGIEK